MHGVDARPDGSLGFARWDAERKKVADALLLFVGAMTKRAVSWLRLRPGKEHPPPVLPPQAASPNPRVQHTGMTVTRWNISVRASRRAERTSSVSHKLPSLAPRLHGKSWHARAETPPWFILAWSYQPERHAQQRMVLSPPSLGKGR